LLAELVIRQFEEVVKRLLRVVQVKQEREVAHTALREEYASAHRLHVGLDGKLGPSFERRYLFAGRGRLVRVRAIH